MAESLGFFYLASWQLREDFELADSDRQQLYPACPPCLWPEKGRDERRSMGAFRSLCPSGHATDKPERSAKLRLKKNSGGDLPRHCGLPL